MDAGFCVAALEEALARYGRPEIFNTDQGSQFTSFAFTSVLREAEVRIRMDGRGRSMKYECVYLHAFETGSELKAALADGSPITTLSVRTRAWPGEPRSRPIGGSGNQIMGGMPPMI